jgi:hypothetical protein
MGTINLADKYSQKVAERFALSSITDAYAGKDYEFSGVKSIKIYSVNTVAMTDYTRSGTERFGALNELGDTVQEMAMTKDRAFTYSIYKGNAAQQFNVKQANQSLKRQIDEVVTPEIDIYRLSKWTAGAGTTNADGSITKSNALEKIFGASAAMSNLLVPKTNRTLNNKFLSALRFLQHLSANVRALAHLIFALSHALSLSSHCRVPSNRPLWTSNRAQLSATT